MQFLQKSIIFSQKAVPKIIFSGFLMLMIFTAFAPAVSLAVCPPDCGTQIGGAGVGEEITLKNPINTDSINGFIKSVLIGLLKIGIPLIAIAIIYCGFLYVTALGNPGKIETANRAFMYTIIGAGILLGAWAIAQLISDTVLSL